MFPQSRGAHHKQCCLLICILAAVKTVETSSDFCIVTRSTKKVVPSCPDSLDKWSEASKRKNCTQYASQCSEPEKLEYHCVINPFINETLEVCAYGQYIISGHCTEYSSSGNLIQPNLNTNCMNFSSKPCPVAYKSTEAYKYPGCYDLTKKTTVTEQTETKSYPKFATVASYISSSQIFVKVDKEDNADRSTDVLTIGLITALVLLLITSVLLLLLIRHLKKKHRSRGNRYVVKDFEKNSNEVLHFTNVENENEIPLMEDEDPDEECRRLVRVVNDTLEKIVFIQHEHGHNEVTLLDERFDNSAFLSDASTEKIREESQYLKSCEEQMINYFKREKNVKKE